jgi:hypothetical protein
MDLRDGHAAGGAGAPLIEKVRFAADSPLEGKRFEPSVPQEERFCEQTSSSPPAGKIV